MILEYFYCGSNWFMVFHNKYDLMINCIFVGIHIHFKCINIMYIVNIWALTLINMNVCVHMFDYLSMCLFMYTVKKIHKNIFYFMLGNLHFFKNILESTWISNNVIYLIHLYINLDQKYKIFCILLILCIYFMHLFLLFFIILKKLNC